MKKQRIIPCLDVDHARVVKGQQFQNIHDVADPVTLAKAYNDAGADELTLYDITAAKDGRTVFLDVVARIAAATSIPLTVGGGIRTTEDIQRVLQAGADKVSINSAAIARPDFIKEAAYTFGPSRIVLSMDVKEIAPQCWRVYSGGGQTDTAIDAIAWARTGEKRGAGEIVVNAIDTDGEQDGFHLCLTKAISQATAVPIVASGGAGKATHFAEAFHKAQADGALAASVFHYGDIDIPGLKTYLQKQNTTFRGGIST